MKTYPEGLEGTKATGQDGTPDVTVQLGDVVAGTGEGAKIIGRDPDPQAQADIFRQAGHLAD